ncbi:hypothetical protein F2Q70_00001522 [Brassica cretica]|uniref:Uncharacterized protein n=1 Tax=Brassica cretica TaxID=69181 RepID=A0A3N6RJ82_BRACR|nr:hypothetical protein F2Q70_00001522 [Brassica cretica]KAF3561481.1 hypothetical protein DY000_02012518 [Brassica cretica]
METDEHRSTSDSPHQSTEEVSTEEVASCATVNILIHEEFAAKHPHPPKPLRFKKSDIDRHQEPAADRQPDSTDDRHNSCSVDQQPPLTYRPKIDVARLNALRNPSQPSEHIADNFDQHSDDAPEPMQVDQTSQRRTLRRRKEKVPKHLKRRVNEKEMYSFTKRVLRIPLDKPFEEAYFTHMLWMFFRKTKETEQDIHRIFNHVREKMKQRITLKKNSDPGKFAVPCLLKGIEFPCALCGTYSSVSILPKAIADHLGLKIEPSEDSFTFVDFSTKNSYESLETLRCRLEMH